MKALAASAVIDGHVRALTNLAGPLLDGTASAEYKKLAVSALKKIAEVETEIFNALSPQERQDVAKQFPVDAAGILSVNGQHIDLRSVNRALGLPEPVTGVSAMAGPPGDAAVFGFLVMAYSCCNGGGGGIMLGMGARPCGSGFRVPGCN